MKINNHNYTTFQILHRNIRNLKTLRPDFYIGIHVRNGGYPIEGEIIKKLAKLETWSEIDTYYSQVISMNTSIILNATAFFEGALETLLIKRLDRIFTVSSINATLYKNFKNKIVRCSSFNGLKNHFKTLFECTMKSQLPKMQSSLNFIEAFYHIRHELAHASEIPTEAIHSDKGGTLILHNTPQYSQLFSFLKNHYKLKEAPTADIQTILMFSNVIDDFSNSIQEIIEYLAGVLREKELIYSDNGFWDKFKKII